MNLNNNFGLLRLVAALTVIFTHAWEITGKPGMEPLMALSDNTISIGFIGLYIFFFTGGMLITNSALVSDNTKHFLFKRFLRIFPALIVVVLISVFIAGPLLTRLSTADYFKHPHTWAYLLNMAGIRKWFYLPGVFQDPKIYTDSGFNLPLWTLGLELKLYISIAILLATGWIHNKRSHLLICSGAILAVMGLWIVRHNGYLPVRFIGQKDLLLIVAFWLGSLIVVCKPSETFLKIAGTVAGISFLLRLAGVIPNIRVDEIVLFSIVTYFLAFAKFRVQVTNDISYGMYLVSMPVQQVCYILTGYNTNPWLNMLLCLIPTVILAWLSWKNIEQPCLQLKHLHKGRPRLAQQPL